MTLSVDLFLFPARAAEKTGFDLAAMDGAIRA